MSGQIYLTDADVDLFIILLEYVDAVLDEKLEKDITVLIKKLDKISKYQKKVMRNKNE